VLRYPSQLWEFMTTDTGPSGCGTCGNGLQFRPTFPAVAVDPGRWHLEFAADTLSSNVYLHQMSRHYSIPVAAIFVCAGVCAIARLATPRRRTVATVVVLLCALWSCVLWGTPLFRTNKILPANPDDPSVLALDQLVTAHLPANAVLSTADNLAPNLDHRDQIYLFPTPFSQLYTGNSITTGPNYPWASQVQYLLLPSLHLVRRLHGQIGQTVFNRISSQFHLVGSTGQYMLYKRDREPPGEIRGN